MPPNILSERSSASKTSSPGWVNLRLQGIRHLHSLCKHYAKLWAATPMRLFNRTFGLQASSVDIETIRAEQAQTLATMSFLFAATGTNGVGLIWLEFRHEIGPIGFLFCFSIVGLYAWWAINSLGLLKNNNHVSYLRSSFLTLVSLGISWGGFVNYLSLVALAVQHNIVTAVILGLVSTPMLTAPFSASMAFFIPISICALIAVDYSLRLFDYSMMLCFLSYLAFIFGGIVILNRTSLERSIGRVRLQHQNETIKLFLRDYEETANEWIWEIDEHFRLRTVPQRLASLLSTTCGLIEGRTIHELFGLDTSSHQSARELSALLDSHTAFRDYSLYINVDGKACWWCLTGRPLVDERACFKGYRGIGSDVTELRLADERIRFLASYDTLTGLFNRQMFLDRLRATCEIGQNHDRQKLPFVLILIDLDRFKAVNDAYGHGAGDALLMVVGERLRSTVQEPSIVARFGGDEFAILMPHCQISDGIEVAKRLISDLEQEVRLPNAIVSVGASLGVVSSLDDGATPTDLLRRADLALYNAKEQRGTFQIYMPWMSMVHDDYLELQSDLHLSLAAGQLGVEFQPIFNVSTGKIVSVETLARWNHPVRGAISPSKFILLAEESLFISAMGEFILREACRSAADWTQPISVAVNISPKQFNDPTLVRMIQQVMAETRLAPERLELEITESTWLSSTPQTLDNLGKLAKLGVKVVLDDFGTGFSSLSSLQRFKFDGIKMDASFVQSIERTEKGSAIVRMIARLAAEINVPLTAEGVETLEQLTKLRELGVHQVQGFLLGRPMSRDAMSRLVFDQNEV